MNRKTLEEVFPPVPQPSQRNFIRENVLRVRKARCASSKRTNSETKTAQAHNSQSLSRVDENHPAPSKPKQHVRRPAHRSAPQSANPVITCDRGMQTEPTAEFKQALPYVGTGHGHGDTLNAKAAQKKTIASVDSAPINQAQYATGAAVLTNVQTFKWTPGGLKMLSAEERERSLRLLMDSYKEKIKDMNSLPVRSDTLKIQRRKMELEEELKKIDDGIQIFLRAKTIKGDQ